MKRSEISLIVICFFVFFFFAIGCKYQGNNSDSIRQQETSSIEYQEEYPTSGQYAIVKCVNTSTNYGDVTCAPDDKNYLIYYYKKINRDYKEDNYPFYIMSCHDTITEERDASFLIGMRIEDGTFSPDDLESGDTGIPRGNYFTILPKVIGFSQYFKETKCISLLFPISKNFTQSGNLKISIAKTENEIVRVIGELTKDDEFTRLEKRN